MAHRFSSWAEESTWKVLSSRWLPAWLGPTESSPPASSVLAKPESLDSEASLVSDVTWLKGPLLHNQVCAQA